MSWRTDQPFGSLVDTVAKTGTAQPRTPWCLIDGRYPGVIATWTNRGGAWTALVCYVKDGELHSATLPAQRLSPH